MRHAEIKPMCGLFDAAGYRILLRDFIGRVEDFAP